MWSYLVLVIMPAPDAIAGGARPHLPHPELAAKRDNESQVRSQIDSLGSVVFGERESATTQLIRAGLPAMPQLETALQSTNAEVRGRAVRIFGEWLTSLDRRVARAAEAALERAANGGAVVASSARMRLHATRLDREAELVAEMERLVPLPRLDALL